MFLGQFKQEMKGMEEKKEEPKTTEKPPEEQKSPTSEDFLKTPEAKDFVNKWAKKTNEDGKPVYTKRGVTALLGALHQVGGLDTNKKVLKAADEILLKLGGMDGLQGFLMGWKAKSEGIIKGLKSIIGK